MRIGEPGRRHGASDEDIEHAIRNAIRQHIADEFAMLIGPATDGTLLGIGILDLEGEDPVVIDAMPTRPKFLPKRTVITMTKHTDKQINEAAARFEQWADALDPAKLDDISDLREIATTASAIRADEAKLREAVQIARGHGHSWNRIAVALGVSRQAARQRYAENNTA